jgi:hypothetical protein
MTGTHAGTLVSSGVLRIYYRTTVPTTEMTSMQRDPPRRTFWRRPAALAWRSAAAGAEPGEVGHRMLGSGSAAPPAGKSMVLGINKSRRFAQMTRVEWEIQFGWVQQLCPARGIGGRGDEQRVRSNRSRLYFPQPIRFFEYEDDGTMRTHSAGCIARTPALASR